MREKRLSLLKDFLWLLTFAGIGAGVLRFAWGLGATSGLNDASPWGLWIAFKLGFVALAGGGFTLAALVYVFRLERFRPLARRAILLALLGYGSFIVSLLFDLGLPWHIYMPIIHWQHHSIMFEIAWCVMLYFTVLVLEFAPVILEHRWFDRPPFRTLLHALHRAVIPLVIAGIVLSTLHQSSLGGLFLMMPHRVHPLWYSAWIPVMFFISAIAAGLLALIIESRIAAGLFGRGVQDELLERLGKTAGLVLWLYLGLRLGDLLWRGVLPGALDGSWQAQLWTLEIVVGGVVPAVLLAIPAVRRNPAGLTTSAVLGVGGILSQRMALSMFTMARPLLAYMPSGLEIVIAFAIPAAAGLVYLFFNENLAVADEAGPVREPARRAWAEFDPAFYQARAGGMPAVARRLGVGVFALALVAALAPVPGAAREAPPVPAAPARGWETLAIDGDRDGVVVSFPHLAHQQRQAGVLPVGEQTEQACLGCHHVNPPGDVGAACSGCHRDVQRTTAIFDHAQHLAALGGNQACAECHTGEHLASTAGACVDCHTDMAPPAGRAVFTPLAQGYQAALHDRCLNCHLAEAEAAGRADLGACQTCHQAPVEQLENLQAQAGAPAGAH